MLSIAQLVLIALLTACSNSGTPSGGSVPTGTTTFTVTTPNAPSSYNINGVENPSLTVQRGQTYTFNLTASGHPFYIMAVQGTSPANAFTTGVMGNGNQTGTLTFAVPSNAPSTLFYDCSNHSAMTGQITVTN